jgi:hypothetical protein
LDASRALFDLEALRFTTVELHLVRWIQGGAPC